MLLTNSGIETFVKKNAIYRKNFNLRKYKYSDSVKMTRSKVLANNLAFSKSIRIKKIFLKNENNGVWSKPNPMVVEAYKELF